MSIVFYKNIQNWNKYVYLKSLILLLMNVMVWFKIDCIYKWRNSNLSMWIEYGIYFHVALRCMLFRIMVCFDVEKL